MPLLVNALGLVRAPELPPLSEAGPLVSERRDRNDGGLFSLIYLELLVGVGWYVP